MPIDFRSDQVQTSKIIVTGNTPQKTLLIYGIAADDPLARNQGNIDPSVFVTSSIGEDVFLFVSGSSNAKTLFGGDVKTSGSFRSLNGITGSIKYTDGSSTPFIVAGPDITTTYNSLGQWEISGSTPVSYFTSPSNGIVQTTGSLLAVGLSSSNGAKITGSLEVLGGITGSISGTIAGNPFLVAGPNVTVNYNTLGQWAITSSGGAGSNLWTELNSTHIYTTSSAAVAHLSVSLGAEIGRAHV